MLTQEEQDQIFLLAEKLTGASRHTPFRHGLFINNIVKRIEDLGLANLHDYLNFVDSSPDEYDLLISLLTIHTTAWFREAPHFSKFDEILKVHGLSGKTFHVWCSACSTGEEVYSFALLLEQYRRSHSGFEYRIKGTDIDPLALDVARQAIYRSRSLANIPEKYYPYVLEGQGNTEGLITLCPEIRKRCDFEIHDLRSDAITRDGDFDVVICRNVLIYFNPETVETVIRNQLKALKPEGYLFLGHSEVIRAASYKVQSVGSSVYHFSAPPKVIQDPGRKKILVVDDSASMRRFLTRMMDDLSFEVKSAASAEEAAEIVTKEHFDLITLDLHMPGMGGEQWLQQVRVAGLSTPVVIISSAYPADADAVLKLFEIGAQDYIDKDELSSNPEKVKDIVRQLIYSEENKRAARKKMRFKGYRVPDWRPEIIMIGASTGGPQALNYILRGLPSSTPPVLVVQHISHKFALPFADRLVQTSGLKLGQIEDGAPLICGHLYMALGDYHVGVKRRTGAVVLDIIKSGPVNGHRPSVDILFNSGATVEQRILALLLTGMGKDGALGMRYLRQAGGFTVAQSEEDAVIFGMPRAAIELDAVNSVANLENIRKILMSAVRSSKIA